MEPSCLYGISFLFVPSKHKNYIVHSNYVNIHVTIPVHLYKNGMFIFAETAQHFSPATMNDLVILSQPLLYWYQPCPPYRP
jgi:hypothetical protein